MQVGFAVGHRLAQKAGAAAINFRPHLAPAVVPALARIEASLLTARAATATGLELGARTVHLGLTAGERLLSSSSQLEFLTQALPKIADLVRRFAAECSEVSTPALLHALYALSCVQATGGPLHPEARSVCDACARADASSAPVLTPPLAPGEAAELCEMAAYATGAYGSAALAVLGGKGAGSIVEGMRADTRAGMAARLGLEAADIVVFKTIGELYRPAHFVALERRRRRIVVALRGTVNVLDSLTNLTCEVAPAPGGLAHEGMLVAARELAAGAVGAAVEALSAAHPGFALRLTGHSQGAGVASLLAQLWVQRYPHVRCFAFAPPCVLTLAAARALAPCVTSIVFGDDLIARLSLGSVEDLRNAAAALATDPMLCSRVAAAVGPPPDDGGPESPTSPSIAAMWENDEPVAAPADAEALGPDGQRLWVTALRNTLHATMQNEKLYPPGRILWLPAELGRDGNVAAAGWARWAEPDSFCEITISGTMFAVRACCGNGGSLGDRACSRNTSPQTHLPHVVESAVRAVFAPQQGNTVATQTD